MYMHESFGTPRLTDLEMLILRYLFKFGLPVPSNNVCCEMRLSPNGIDFHLARLRDLGLLKFPSYPGSFPKLALASSSLVKADKSRSCFELGRMLRRPKVQKA